MGEKRVDASGVLRVGRQCIEALRADGRDIWATDLSTEAVPLTFPNTSTSASPAPTTTASSSALDSSKSAILPTKSGDLIIPKKLAVVFGAYFREILIIFPGREADGCSQEILTAADKRIYFRLHGFTESLNLSVASGLVLQHLFFLCPEARGDLLTSAPTVAAEVRYLPNFFCVIFSQRTVVQTTSKIPKKTFVVSPIFIGSSASIQ